MKLIDKKHLIDNLWTFSFDAERPIRWTAGQFIQVELPHDNPDSEGTERWFTVSSAPYEEVLRISTRITDSTFKQALNALPIGGEIKLAEIPDGSFTWKDTDRPIVFIAGGIGITPFHSILKQRFHNRSPLKVTLIYGNRTDAIPFKDEIDKWAKDDPNFKLHYLVNSPLTAESITKLAPNINKSLVYISGPEPMVETIGDALEKAGLPHKQLEQDFFPNYNESNY